MADEPTFVEKAPGWIWNHWDKISERLSTLFSWIRGKIIGPSASLPDDVEPNREPGILIIGPAGAGKTTLAKLMVGEYTTRLYEDPWTYTRTIGIETYRFPDNPGMEIIVPPGHALSREATWPQLLKGIKDGNFRGVVLVVSYGYQTVNTMGGISKHPLYQGSRDQFRRDYQAQQLTEELNVLKRVSTALESAQHRVWLLILVTKADLWWNQRNMVDEHYAKGEWEKVIAQVTQVRGIQNFRCERTAACLVISNLRTTEGEIFAKNVEGYDQQEQVRSLRTFIETLDALHQWEEN